MVNKILNISLVTKIIEFRLFFAETNTYKIDLDEDECMSFSKKDKEFVEMCNETLEKVRNIVKIKFNSELIYSKEYLKAEKKIYNKNINTKECSWCIYISAILINLVYIKVKNYYPQVFLEKYEHVAKKRGHILLLTS